MTPPAEQPSDLAPGRLLLVLVGLNVLWAPVNFWVKVAAGGGVSGVVLGTIRWSLLAALMFGLLQLPAFRKLTRYKPLDGKSRLRALLIGFLLFGPAHLLYYTSMPKTSSLEGTVLLTTAPLWTTLLPVLMLGERADLRRWAALLLAIVGAYITSVGFQAPKIEGSHLVGNAMFFVGVTLECLNGVLAARTSRETSGIGTLAWQILGAVPAFLLAVVIMRPEMPTFTPAAVGAIFYLVVVSGVVTFSTWYVLTERAPLSLMVLPIGLQPPIAAVLGFFVLGEAITPAAPIGALLILLALALAFLRSRQAASPGPAPFEPTSP